jgi:hypothetical protein
MQFEENWSFGYAKELNIDPEAPDELGHAHAWPWTALDADTKLAVPIR